MTNSQKTNDIMQLKEDDSLSAIIQKIPMIKAMEYIEDITTNMPQSLKEIIAYKAVNEAYTNMQPLITERPNITEAKSGDGTEEIKFFAEKIITPVIEKTIEIARDDICNNYTISLFDKLFGKSLEEE